MQRFELLTKMNRNVTQTHIITRLRVDPLLQSQRLVEANFKFFTDKKEVSRSLDQVMKQEVLNGKRLHRGSDKKCTVPWRIALQKKKKKEREKKGGVYQSMPLSMTQALVTSFNYSPPIGRADLIK